MSKTRAELINQCLTNLGIIAEGQSISPEDVEKMDTIVDPALSELSELDIYYVSDKGDIGPSGGEFADSAFLSLSSYIANAACAAFNLPADQKLQALALLAEQKLQTLSRPASTLRTLRVDPALRTHRLVHYRGGS
jgi:hypothetical protein